jgi:hypothetical protein
VHDTEDGRAHADAQRDDQHDEGGEARGFPQHAGGVTDVLRDRVRERQAACVAMGLAQLRRAAECVPCQAPRLDVGMPPATIAIFEQADVCLELVEESAILGLVMPPVPDPDDDAAQPGPHGVSGPRQGGARGP